MSTEADLTGRFPERSPVVERPAASGGVFVSMKDQLLVVSVNLLKNRAGPNRTEHRTDRYHSNSLIIRRGQTFYMWIEFSRPFKPSTDKLNLEFKIGNRPNVSKGTLVTFPVTEVLKGNCWEAKIVEKKDNKVKLSVNSLPTAAIGQYELTVFAVTPKGTNKSSRNPENDIIMLFNPWCRDDAVYMEKEEERKEYVLNDLGKLYYGTEFQISSRSWNYGQFADGVLTACLFMLDQSGSDVAGRGDPINVARVVSAMVNSNDDKGVLEGNWSNKYIGGTSPTSWTGSVDILRQYYRNGPVKYGQCWVFCGVTTTVLRCLGIPTRSITNFNSAHDTDVSLTTDVYIDEKRKPIESLNKDSIWNFHCWNESWMTRPDLPKGFGGWQVVDATPQETSQGIFCCGPTSVVAIRDGQVFHKYDGHFVFAEVNSDKIYWQRQANGTFTQIQCEKNVVGHSISTKAVGSDERIDITNLYKHPEDSKEERNAVETASRHGSKPDVYNSLPKDVTVEVSLNGEEPRVGEDAQLSIVVKNNTSQTLNTTINIHVAVVYYTGVHKATVRKDELNLTLKPKEVQNLKWTLKYENYKDELVGQGSLKLTLTGLVKETQQVLATQFDFRLAAPRLIVAPVGDAVVGKEMAVKISFTNPLPRPLNKVSFRIEGLGLVNSREITHGTVAALAAVTLTEKFIPTMAGNRKLLASMDSEELKQVHGFADIVVKDK